MENGFPSMLMTLSLILSTGRQKLRPGIVVRAFNLQTGPGQGVKQDLSPSKRFAAVRKGFPE